MLPPSADPIVTIPECSAPAVTPEAAPVQAPPEIESQDDAIYLNAQISALLGQSRAAHDRKKKAAGLTDKDGKITRTPDYREAEAEMREALRLREEAHALDPDHTSPAWHADQLANKGLSHQQIVEWMQAYAEIP